MRFFKKAACFLIGILVFISCRKSNVASWDVDLVLPVVSSELNIKNFLGDSIFKADNTGLLNLTVTRTLTAIKLDSLIKLPDTTIVNSFTLPVFNATLQPGDVLPTTPPTPLTFSVGNGAALKRIDVRTGSITVTFSNTTNQPLDIVYQLPGTLKYGQKFTISETVPAPVAPATSGVLVKSYDLSGYSFNLTGTGVNYNTLLQTYTVSVSPSAPGPATLTFGQGAKTQISYKDLIPDYVEGYFGQQDITIPLDTTRLNILKSFDANNFMLSDASFIFRIMNEFGAEFSSSLSNIKSINGPSVVPLSTQQLSNININRASKSGNTVFPSVKTVSLVTGNSNIVSFLSNLPDRLTYQGNVKVNPLGNLSGYNDFAFYGTGINVLADINIPLRFRANYFKLVSHTKIDFSNVKQLDNVNYGRFIISASNGYPFSSKLQAYLLDENDAVIDSLLINGSNTISGGQLNNQNRVVLPSKSSIEMPLDKDIINNLKRSKNIRIESYFIMPPSPPDVTIYENYVFDINITAELNYRVERK